MYSVGRCPISLIVIFEAQFQNPQMLFLFFNKFYIYNVHNWPAGLVFTFGCNHLGNSISNQRTMFAVCGLHIMCTLYNFNFQSSIDVISRCPIFQFFFRNKMLAVGIWINFFWQSFQQFVISFRSQKVVAYHTLQVTLWSSAILNRSQNKKRAQKLKWRRKIRA